MSTLQRVAVPSVAARLADIPRTTLLSAIARGEIRTQKLAGGTIVVVVRDVKTWKTKERRPGRRC